jgi:hypothetical protein
MACLYYFALLTDGDWNPFGNEFFGLVFNDMLAHLVRGEVTIDPAIIRNEAYVRDGHTFAYWGIFPAFLRLPLLFLGVLHEIQIARLSCWIAICLMAGSLVAMLAATYRLSAPTLRATLLFYCLVVGTLFAGIVVSSLASAYVYNEPLFWAAAFSVVFNYIVLRRLLIDDMPLGARDLAVLACLAGLALNSRVLEGIGLYLSMGWILLLTLFRGGLRKVLVPTVILAAFVAICGSVNYLRWGSPLTFMDLRLHVQILESPRRFAVLNDYGALNLLRLPFAFAYYFFGTAGVVELQPIFPRLLNLYDGIEGPSSSFILTEPLPLLLAALGAASVFRRPMLGSGRGAILAGVLVAETGSIGFLLAAEYLAMRYRMDFLPAFSLAGVLGYFVLTTRFMLSRRVVSWAVALTFVSVMASHISLILYKEQTRPLKEEARLFWEKYQSERFTLRPPAVP